MSEINVQTINPSGAGVSAPGEVPDATSDDRLFDTPVALRANRLCLRYGEREALRNVSLTVPQNRITAFIGPSGCGKSSLLRCFNRMNDLVDEAQVSGHVAFDGQDIYAPGTDVVWLRRRIGMVFQKPNPFPKSVYENVAFGLRLLSRMSKSELDEQVEQALVSAALWEEVKDRLHEPAYKLSGGQQQRLVIARAIAVQPSVLLLDEPASSLDPLATLKIEELIYGLRDGYTIVIVTHNMQQAARVSDYTAFMDMGEIVEFGTTNQVFTRPRQTRTEDYITGRYG